ncbi:MULTISPECIES: hypothetical protein [Morganellaceae]|uniref:hypothetical protein n=1 Tax=Morganellaceae TaxID=1903414 RepID=UPI000D6FDA93|nr:MULTISPECIES: hypothetical protein [Morganellaceae]QXX82911.1 hypothetical protein J6836_00515 [Providencia sp. R33]
MTEQYEYASIRVEMASDATIRDYFAAKVMQGDFAAQSNDVGIYGHHLTDEQLADMSKFYYRMADAMLKARG